MARCAALRCAALRCCAILPSADTGNDRGADLWRACRLGAATIADIGFILTALVLVSLSFAECIPSFSSRRDVHLQYVGVLDYVAKAHKCSF